MKMPMTLYVKRLHNSKTVFGGLRDDIKVTIYPGVVKFEYKNSLSKQYHHIDIARSDMYTLANIIKHTYENDAYAERG